MWGGPGAASDYSAKATRPDATEDGSSGSPIMNSSGQVVGQLSGAPSAADTSALQTVNGVIEGNTEALAMTLFTRYLVPFEVVSVVLLVAMIGAIVFGRRDAALVERGEGVEL